MAWLREQCRRLRLRCGEPYRVFGRGGLAVDLWNGRRGIETISVPSDPDDVLVILGKAKARRLRARK